MFPCKRGALDLNSPLINGMPPVKDIHSGYCAGQLMDIFLAGPVMFHNFYYWLSQLILIIAIYFTILLIRNAIGQQR
jgi:hypothetical protein